ncbi:MAG: CoA-binding protein [Candidatus Micrarchaeota archaeon]|nr:CoA-binding protein [Candidatus Micrarchaeota archaeon]
MMRDLKKMFEPESIAVIGASREPNKIGHVILKNLVEGGFSGQVYPVNPSAEIILYQHAFASVKDIPSQVDLAIITTPQKAVLKVLEECGEKGIKNIVIITSGFAEVGNVEDENKVREIAKRYGMAIIGVNCMGFINPYSRVDSVFNPVYKLGRPKAGEIAFISQSGAIGAAVMDLAAKMGVGISLFVSYGNATVVDETDLLEHLYQDKRTKVIAMYIEGVKDGRRFLEVAKKVTKKKPIILIKAGKTEAGVKAAASHTAALAGDYSVYSAAFRQAGIIEVESLTDLFDFSKIFLQPFPKGKRVGIITNGGGIGVLTADQVLLNGLEIAEYKLETKIKLREAMPMHVNITNPLDLAGDADASRFRQALEALYADENVDIIILTPLMQTVHLDPSIIDLIVSYSQKMEKPISVITIGGSYTEQNRALLENGGVPTYTSPYVATKAISKLAWYAGRYGKE